MAYGTAPHRVAPGVWATQDGRRLTPAGSAYWEHHHALGLVTADGHVVHPALTHPTATLAPKAPPPRGQPTITAPQWKKMTPPQKMATEVTVPYKGKKYNVPIGFGGASNITQRMAAQAAARAAQLKAHLPGPQKATQLTATLKQPSFETYLKASKGDQAARGEVGRWNVRNASIEQQRAWVQNQTDANLFGGKDARTVLDAQKLVNPMVAEVIKGFDPVANAKLAFGAARHGDVPAAALYGASILPFGPGGGFLRGGLAGARAARAARQGESVAKAVVKVMGKEGIPARDALSAVWKQRGFTPEQINHSLAVYDNQAALHPGGVEDWWHTRVGLGGKTPAEVAAQGGRVLHQETPQAARAKARAKAADTQRPPNTYWRDKHGIPHNATKKDFVEGVDVTVPGERQAYIPDIVFSPETTRGNLIAKLFPQKGTPDGIPKTRDLWKRAADGQEFKIAGDITKEDWVHRVLAVIKNPKLIDDLARWYETLPRTFKQAFGDDADEMIRALAVSQANASPASGTMASLKVRDRLVAGNPLTKNEYSTVGLNIQKAFRDGKIDSGIAAKLSDFIDSLAGRDTRTWMGHDPRGGSPSAVDVHAVRDRGFVDPKLQARLEAAGFTRGKDFRLEGDGTASGAKYERISEWYDEIAQHLNDIEFNGRKDWTPRQAQALGWSAIQMAHGVVPEGALEALGRNTRTIGFEVTKGVGELGADLSAAQTRTVAKAMLPHARALADDMPGLWVRDARVTQGGWGSGSNIMIEVEVLGSEQAVQDALTHYAQAFDQGGVQAAREVSRDTARAAVIIHSPAFKNPRTVEKFWEALNRLSPLDKRRTVVGPGGERIPNPSHGEAVLAGYMPWDEEGVPAIAIRTASPTVSPKTQQEFIDKFKDAITQAEHEAEIEVGYTARNIELLTGDQSGATNPLQTLPGGWDTRGRAATLAHPRSAGIRADLEATIDRVRAGKPARGDPGSGEVGRVLHQRSPDPASSLPKGATEFLKDGSRVHFFEGADVSTAMHELLHVSIHDLRGRHLDTLAHEFAGGKALEHWTDAEHEAVASAFEQWLRTGTIENPKLRGPFNAIKEWMLAIVGRAKDAGMPVPKDVEDAFNYMFREPLGTTLEEQVVGAAKRAPGFYEAQKIDRSIALGQRVSKMMEADKTGVAGHLQQLEALKGEMPRAFVDDLTHLTPEDLDYLREAVKNTKLRPLEQISLFDGIRAAQKGDVLTPSLTKLVLKAWAPPGTPGAGRTAKEWAWHIINEVVNIPRSIMASGDASGVFRQALMAFAMHPLLVTKEMGPMFHYLLSEKKYLKDMEWLAKDPKAQLMAAHGTEFTDLMHHFSNREEQFVSSYAEVLTGGKHGLVRRSGRAYTGLLNNVRYALNDNMYRIAEKQGMDLTSRDAAITQELKDMSTVANWATGRGHLGEYETQKMLLNTFLFSPRLLKSRFDMLNPFFYSQLSPIAQKQALRGVVSLVLGGVGVLSMAKLAGTNVVLDPYSSDFGKIKVGNHRFDVWGGHQQMVRTIMQEIKGQATKTTTGETVSYHRGFPTLKFFRGKLSPPVGLFVDQALGKNAIGQPVDWKGLGTKGVLQTHLTPLAIQDAIQAYFDDNSLPWGAGVFGATFFGVGAQTYPMQDPSGGNGYQPPSLGSSGGYQPPSLSGGGGYQPPG